MINHKDINIIWVLLTSTEPNRYASSKNENIPFRSSIFLMIIFTIALDVRVRKDRIDLLGKF